MQHLDLATQNQISTEQLAKLGQMTACILHDVNSTLTTLNLNLQLIDQQVITQHPQLQSSLQCVQQLISLMATARRQVSGGQQRELLDLETSVDKVLALLRYKLQLTDITIHKAISPMEIFADSARIEQLILNLILNAIEAIERDTKQTRLIELKGEKIFKYPNKNIAQPFYRFTIKDSGTGIARAHLQKIFQPYFTSKSSTNSIGLGMQIIKQIVENELKGEIRVNSMWGLGTEMIVTFQLQELKE